MKVIRANLEAERALLGAILVNNDSFFRVSGFLKPKHFSDPVNQKIYKFSRKLIKKDKKANPVTLREFFPSNTTVGVIKIDRYLATIAADATSIINAEDYGWSIYNLAIQGTIISVCKRIMILANDPPVDMPPALLIENAKRKLDELADLVKAPDPLHPSN